MISIINYGMGNIRSIQNALSYLGYESQVTNNPSLIFKSDKLILPGVGSFNQAMSNLRNLGLVETIQQAVWELKVPILGICLGMQLLADDGEEDGYSKGLGLISGSVKKFSFTNLSIKIPHIGFNTALFNPDNRQMFEGLSHEADFYFVHSYRMICKDPIFVSSWTYYGDEKFVSAVHHQNIFGTQFHPEKSQSNGLRVLDKFCR